MKKVFFKTTGVWSDLCIYSQNYSSTYLYLLSIYGAPQQVKAVGSALVGFRNLEVHEDGTKIQLTRRWDATYRMKKTSLGYGKAHLLVYAEDVGTSWTFWVNQDEDEKLRVFEQALSKRKIPYEKGWLPRLEKLLIKNELLGVLGGWGGGGYDLLYLDDDSACNLIVEEVIKKGGEHVRCNKTEVLS